jgi:Zn-dependent M16 (insulinase) family peptidase
MTKTAFDLLIERPLPEVSSTARLYRHKRTGAELLSLSNSDENKVFGITFRTPPEDSTGVAHILEHSVLCGSRKYPVKEPFVELMKGSLHTFLNAMTYPDKTVYPVASQNLQDFYNLVDVYLDAVLFPKISEDIFRQEGWHYELDSVAADLRYKGVVFNEMKGAYSSPESRLSELSQQSLFPDTTYGVDSGGHPAHIPDLTYAQFKDFHARHYHPSNARAFFYGDDDPAKRLEILDAYFSAFERVAPRSSVALQRKFAAPKELRETYAAGPRESDAGKAMVTVNWMLDETADPTTALALHVLDRALVGSPAAPLRKALIDSGLGEATVGGGLEDDLRQPTFSMGLKGVDPANAGKVEPLILKTLTELARDGIDRQTVDAALNTTEFRLRENNTGSFPRGISLMLRSMRDWLHDRDPLAPLAFEAPLAAIRRAIAGDPRFFEGMIRRHFLDNPHRTTLTLTADPQQTAREADAERRRLQAVQSALPASGLSALVEATQALKLKQETPDPPEALAAIPSLALGDLPRRNKPIPLEVGALAGTQLLSHDLDTSGLIYLDLAFDLHRLAPELLPYMALFSRALLETGAGPDDFIALSQRIGRETGGISAQRWTSARVGGVGSAAWLFLHGKATPERADSLLGILRDVLTSPRLDDRERFQQLVMEEKARFEGRLAPMGLRLVDLRLRASLHEADWAGEQMGGVSYLFFLRRLAEQIQTDWPSVLAALNTIRRTLVDRAGMVVNVTTDAGNRRKFEGPLAAFLADLPKSPRSLRAAWEGTPDPRSEGLTITAPVNFVGKGADLATAGYRPSGATAVAVKHLNTGYLWDKVRVQGGAYGGSSRFDRFSGGFTFLSYRDPNLLATLDIYDQASVYLRNEIGPVELTRSIIGAIGEIDRYMLPDAKGQVSMQRHLLGDTEAARQQMRDELLSAGNADLRSLADALGEAAMTARVVVIGSAAAIAAANAERQGFLRVEKLM